jgi:hypothetical protein
MINHHISLSILFSVVLLTWHSSTARDLKKLIQTSARDAGWILYPGTTYGTVGSSDGDCDTQDLQSFQVSAPTIIPVSTSSSSSSSPSGDVTILNLEPLCNDSNN